jgi:uncharacterized lipoprotein YajG
MLTRLLLSSLESLVALLVLAACLSACQNTPVHEPTLIPLDPCSLRGSVWICGSVPSSLPGS